MKSVWFKSKPGEVGDAVRHAIDVGYRHIDCAHVYENEEEVGIALREKLCDGSVHRNEVYITSKVTVNPYLKLAYETIKSELWLKYVSILEKRFWYLMGIPLRFECHFKITTMLIHYSALLKFKKKIDYPYFDCNWLK